MSTWQKMIFAVIAVLCSILTLNTAAYAATSTGDDIWSFGGAAYLWGAGVEGTDSAGDEIDVSFSDIVKDLDGGLMGIISARKGKWTLLADIIYLSINQETSSTANIIGVPEKVDVDVKLEGFVSTLLAAYRVQESDMTSLDLLVGARYFRVDVDLDVDVGASKTKASDSGDVLDGIIGAQVLLNLSENWYLSCYADVGTGDSKRTWQVWPGFGYRLEKVDVVAGYRHLEWESDDGDTIDDINFSGPMLGVKFRF
jgi:opacity protein-like surface antigen